MGAASTLERSLSPASLLIRLLPWASGDHIAKDLRSITDEKLDTAKELPSGTMTAQQRIERVLIGHIQGHQGSIEATIA